MIHSSLLIRAILAFFAQLNKWYEGSLIHRIFLAMGAGLSSLGRGSAIFGFFRKFDLYLLLSASYIFFRGIFRALNTLIKWVRIRIIDKLEGAKIHQLLEGVTRLDMSLSIFGLMNLGFGLGLIIIYILTKRPQGLLGLLFVLLGSLGLGLSKDSHSKLENSWVIRLFSSLHHLFLPDKEGEKWKF